MVPEGDAIPQPDQRRAVRAKIHGAVMRRRARPLAPGYRLLLVLICMAVSPCGGAEVYRWEDEQGRVHFGDRPPFGEEAEAMAIPLTPSAAVPANIPTEEERRERRRKLLDLYREEREVKRRERDERARRKAEKHNQCARISGQLARYRNAAGIYQRLPDGERRYLSRTEREAEIARLQEAADYWCDE